MHWTQIKPARSSQIRLVQVSLNGALRAGADGAASIEVEAATIRELMNNIQSRYPAMEEYFQRGIAVAINGVVYRDDWSQSIPPDAEVFLMPRIEGG